MDHDSLFAQCEDEVSVLHFNQANLIILCGLASGDMQYFKVRQLQQMSSFSVVSRLEEIHRSAVTCIRSSARLFLCGSEDHVLTLWNFAKMKLTKVLLDGHGSPSSSISALDISERFAVCGDDVGKIAVWSCEDPAKPAKLTTARVGEDEEGSASVRSILLKGGDLFCGTKGGELYSFELEERVEKSRRATRERRFFKTLELRLFSRVRVGSSVRSIALDGRREQNLWLGAKNGIYVVSLTELDREEKPAVLRVLDDPRFDLQQLLVSRRRLFTLTTTGEVRCFELQDLNSAASDGRALRVSRGRVWFPDSRAGEYPDLGPRCCLHGLQLFYSGPGSTRVERMGPATA